jgi:hypothetical protein
LAEKIAARLWKQIQRDDSELAAKILSDRRPQARDHWYAHVGVGAAQRHIGSFTSKAEAQAAYAGGSKKPSATPPATTSNVCRSSTRSGLRGKTSLPARVVAPARTLLDPANRVPASVMQKVVTHWSQPLPV